MVYVYSRSIDESNSIFRVSMRGKQFLQSPPPGVDNPAVDAIETSALELGLEVLEVQQVPGVGCFEVKLSPIS